MNKITYLCMAFLLCALPLQADISNNSQEEANIKRVRLIFHTDIGYQRELLLAFFQDNSASDNYDYGYDAVNADNLPNDMDFLIEERRCVIQGVGEYNAEQSYPFGMHIQMDSKITVALKSTENFIETPYIYIYDSETEEYFNINDEYFITDMKIGNHNERFSIVVSQKEMSNTDESLSLDDIDKDNFKNTISYKYSKNSNQFTLSSSTGSVINSVVIYNISGQRVREFYDVNSNELRINNISNAQGLIVQTRLNDNNTISKKVLLN